MPDIRRIILAVTGASGMPYAATLCRALGRDPLVELHLVVTAAARRVLALEGGGQSLDTSLAHAVHDEDDIGAAPASGSFVHHGMVVCPCSMASLAAIAMGLGSNLVHRAADVALKERRPLVLVPRETPLSRIHLQNMLRAHEAGAVILPACPGFYTGAATIQDLADHLCARILDQLGLAHSLSRRWEG